MITEDDLLGVLEEMMPAVNSWKATSRGLRIGSGLDSGLDYGLDYGLNFGLNWTVASVLALLFKADYEC